MGLSKCLSIDSGAGNGSAKRLLPTESSSSRHSLSDSSPGKSTEKPRFFQRDSDSDLSKCLSIDNRAGNGSAKRLLSTESFSSRHSLSDSSPGQSTEKPRFFQRD